jgi:hypothetical protein
MDQRMYGEMRLNPPINNKSPQLVPCSKCKGMFNIEKQHVELFEVRMFWARLKEGTLTPAREVPLNYYRLCPGCEVKLKEWIK